MNEIVSLVNELQSLTQELKRLHLDSKALRDRKKKCESDILNYLEQSDQPGLKYNNITVFAENKDSFKSSKKEKIARGSEYLSQLGLDGEKIIDELLKTMKGEPISESRLKIIKKKQT
jgi:hypothetical protein